MEDAAFHFDADEVQTREYEVRTAEELRGTARAKVAEVCDTLTVSEGDAFALLCGFKWNKERLLEDWFGDEDRTRQKFHIVKPPPPPSSTGSGVQDLFRHVPGEQGSRDAVWPCLLPRLLLFLHQDQVQGRGGLREDTVPDSQVQRAVPTWSVQQVSDAGGVPDV